MFILPKRVIKDMIKKFNRFLWNGKEGNSAKAKVAWGYVYYPKREGGLGLKCLEEWNQIYAKAYMEFVCLLGFHLGCLGLELFVEREELLETKYPL
jgi:hypothetical protein